MTYSIFDLKILAEHPALLFERGFENVTCRWLGNESPNAARTALGAHAAYLGKHRKTENELPPPHAPSSNSDESLMVSRRRKVGSGLVSALGLGCVKTQ